jgi:hypothetical protein
MLVQQGNDTVVKFGDIELASLIGVTASNLKANNFGFPVTGDITPPVITTSLLNDTGISGSDKITSDSTIKGTVSDSSQLASGGFVQIGTETIGYSNVVGNVLTNCYRGQNGTTAAAHVISSAVSTQNLNSINVWPAPDAGGAPYTFVYWRLRRIQDAGNGSTEQDIPFRLLPCLVAGLSFYMGQKIAEALPRLQFLKSEYEEQWLMASTEDREKAAVRFVPRSLFYS